MRVLRQASEREVLDHWKRLEETTDRPDDEFRTDIRNREFPGDVAWHEAELEAQDADHLFLISSGDERGVDLGGISRGSFLVKEVRLSDPQFDPLVLNLTAGLIGRNPAVEAGEVARMLRGQGLAVSEDAAHPYASQVRHLPRIRRMLDTLLSGGDLPGHAIVVGDGFRGPFTVIDGCHRLVARHHHGTLVGQQVYFGTSSGFVAYSLARYAYRRPALRLFPSCAIREV